MFGLKGLYQTFSRNARKGSTRPGRAHLLLVRNFRHVYNCDIALASTSQAKHVNKPLHNLACSML